MGRHDREHQGDGAWPKDKPLPKETRKDDSGKHGTGTTRDDGKKDDGKK